MATLAERALSSQTSPRDDLNPTAAIQYAGVARKEKSQIHQRLLDSGFDMYQQQLDAVAQAQRAASQLVSDLQSTRATDVGNFLDTYAQVKTALIGSMTDIATAADRTNSRALEDGWSAYEKSNSPIDFWNGLHGGLADTGMLDTNYTGIVDVVSKGLQHFTGKTMRDINTDADVEAALDEMGFVEGTSARSETRRLINQAREIAATHVLIPDLLNNVAELPSLDANATEQDLQRAREALLGYSTQFARTVDTDAMAIADQVNEMSALNDEMQILEAKAQRAEDYAFGQGESDDRLRSRMAAIMANPDFQAWASENGLEIGTGEYTSPTDFDWKPGKDDFRAVRIWAKQTVRPDRWRKVFKPAGGRLAGQFVDVIKIPEVARDAEGRYLLKDGQYVEPGTKIPTSSVEVAVDAEGNPIYRDAEGEFVVDGDGEVLRLTPEQVGLIPGDLQWEGLYSRDDKGNLKGVSASEVGSMESAFSTNDPATEMGYTTTDQPPEGQRIRGERMVRGARETGLGGGDLGADEIMVADTVSGQVVRIPNPDTNPDLYQVMSDARSDRGDRADERALRASERRTSTSDPMFDRLMDGARRRPVSVSAEGIGQPAQRAEVGVNLTEVPETVTDLRDTGPQPETPRQRMLQGRVNEVLSALPDDGARRRVQSLLEGVNLNDEQDTDNRLTLLFDEFNSLPPESAAVLQDYVQKNITDPMLTRARAKAKGGKDFRRQAADARQAEEALTRRARKTLPPEERQRLMDEVKLDLSGPEAGEVPPLTDEEAADALMQSMSTSAEPVAQIPARVMDLPYIPPGETHLRRKYLEELRGLKAEGPVEGVKSNG